MNGKRRDSSVTHQGQEFPKSSVQQTHSISPQSMRSDVTCEHNEDGIVPVSSFKENDNQVRLVKLVMEGGILPVRRLS